MILTLSISSDKSLIGTSSLVTSVVVAVTVSVYVAGISDVYEIGSEIGKSKIKVLVDLSQ